MKSLVLLFTFVALFSFTGAIAQKSAVFAPDGKAIRGYDPVAYFTENKAVKGNPSISYRYQDTDWYFASEKNRETFQANSAKYAPQYGGYCAFGTSRGYKAPTEADAWTIVNGKLYLNYNTDVRTEWNKDQANYIKKADINWPNIKNQDGK